MALEGGVGLAEGAAVHAVVAAAALAAAAEERRVQPGPLLTVAHPVGVDQDDAHSGRVQVVEDLLLLDGLLLHVDALALRQLEALLHPPPVAIQNLLVEALLAVAGIDA